MPCIGEAYNPWRLFVGSFIPNAVLKCRNLSPTSKLIFGRLSQYAGADGQAYPSYRTLGHEVGIEQRQAMRAVKELVVFGLIRSVKQIRNDGGAASNRYEFLWHQIFDHDNKSTVGVICDTGGCVISDKRGGGQKSQRALAKLTPKKIQTNDSSFEETTITKCRLLLSGTPLKAVNVNIIVSLANKHGLERLLVASDLAAETWRRRGKEIPNPEGYLTSLCEFHNLPKWYESYEERNAKSAAAAEKKIADTKVKAEISAAIEKEKQDVSDYWLSLNDDAREKYRAEVFALSQNKFVLSEDVIEVSAKLIAWENKSEAV